MHRLASSYESRYISLNLFGVICVCLYVKVLYLIMILLASTFDDLPPLDMSLLENYSGLPPENVENREKEEDGHDVRTRKNFNSERLSGMRAASADIMSPSNKNQNRLLSPKFDAELSFRGSTLWKSTEEEKFPRSSWNNRHLEDGGRYRKYDLLGSFGKDALPSDRKDGNRINRFVRKCYF